MEGTMNIISRLIFIALILGIVSGCAKHVSQYSFTQPEQAISIPHPVEIEKTGDQYVTVFTAILDAGVWGVEGVGGVGVWPVLAEQKDAKPLMGYAFVTDLNWWGDFLLQMIMVGQKANFANSKIIYLNRDGGWVYDLTGQEFDYSPKKFDKGLVYQKQIFQNGTTLSELESFWKMYSEKRGVKYSLNSSEEILVGSVRWEEFRIQLTERLGHNYKMPGGEIRQGYSPINNFRQEAAQNNGVTAGQRFARNAFIPVAIDPISASIGITSSVLNGLVATSNGPLQGFYARAECLRGDLKPNFRLMQQIYKQLLQQRDAVIYELQN